MDVSVEIDKTIDSVSESITRYGVVLSDTEANLKKAELLKGKMSLDQISLINQSFENYNNIINEGPVESEPVLEQNKRHLRSFLSKFDLSISPKLFSSMRSHHIIEVYSKSHQQMFRSVNFFEFSHYGIDSLTFIPWDQLFNRDEKQALNLRHYANIILNNQLEIFKPTRSKHIITEIETGREFRYELKCAGNCFDKETHHSMGYITLIEVSHIPQQFKLLH